MSELSDSEFDFLMHSLTDIQGIGKATAADIISLKKSFEDFENLGKNDFQRVNRISDDQKNQILDEFRNIDFQQDVRKLWTDRIIREFLQTQYENLRSLTLNDLDINVLLAKALGFTSTEEAVEFYVYQRITRSAVTSWGQGALEDLCIVSGSEEIPRDENVSVSGKAFDMKKQKQEETYYIQLKSGPNTMNVGMVNSLNDMIEEIEDKHRDAIGILGMTYGRPQQVSSQIRGNLNDFDEKALIGKEFWEFLTGDENYYYDLIARIDRISKEASEQFDRTFLEAVDDKIEELSQEWEAEYGARGEQGMEKLHREIH